MWSIMDEARDKFRDEVSTADVNQPYFMTNEAWYRFDPDEEERRYILTPEATQEARASYEEFYHLREPSEEIIRFAQEHGYQGALYLQEWKGYAVYEPYVDRDQVTCTGLPENILVKGNSIRFSTDEEIMDLLEAFNIIEED